MELTVEQVEKVRRYAQVSFEEAKAALEPYVMIPLAILGLIVRCRYHFSGWEWNTDTINRAMDQVTETVADWTEQFKQELKDYHNKRGGTSNKK